MLLNWKHLSTNYNIKARDEKFSDKDYLGVHSLLFEPIKKQQILYQLFYRLENATARRIRIAQIFQQGNIAIYAFLNIQDIENFVLH